MDRTLLLTGMILAGLLILPACSSVQPVELDSSVKEKLESIGTVKGVTKNDQSLEITMKPSGSYAIDGKRLVSWAGRDEQVVKSTIFHLGTMAGQIYGSTFEAHRGYFEDELKVRSLKIRVESTDGKKFVAISVDRKLAGFLRNRGGYGKTAELASYMEFNTGTEVGKVLSRAVKDA